MKYLRIIKEVKYQHYSIFFINITNRVPQYHISKINEQGDSRADQFGFPCDSTKRFKSGIIGIGPGIAHPDNAGGISQYTQHDPNGSIMPGSDIIFNMECPQVHDGIDHGNGKEDHHGKPHANMEIKVADRFFQGRQPGNVHQKSTYKSVKQQDNTCYLPPGPVHIVFFNFQWRPLNPALRLFGSSELRTAGWGAKIRGNGKLKV